MLLYEYRYIKNKDSRLWLFNVVDALISQLRAEKESAESQVLWLVIVSITLCESLPVVFLDEYKAICAL